MFSKSQLTPFLVAALLAIPMPSEAQGILNWVTNEASKIQQDSSSGLINSNQSAQLQNREAQIQNQEQQYLNQNGGTLTAQQQGQIGSELKKLNSRLGKDIAKDNPNLNYGAPPPYPNQWRSWTGTAQASAPPAAWNPNAAPAQWQNANGYPYHRRHHRGIGYNGQSGQYWTR